MQSDNIYGNVVNLIRMTEDDTLDIIRWRNNPRVKSKFIYQELFTLKGHKKWIENMINEGKAVQFIIFERATGRKIGSTYLRDIDYSHNKAEFGIFIGEDDTIGKGYGSEAVELMVQFGFSQLKLHKIFLRVFEDNLSAIRSYKKAGFIIEAKLSDDVHKNDAFANMLLMAVINSREETE